MFQAGYSFNSGMRRGSELRWTGEMPVPIPQKENWPFSQGK